MPLYHLIINGEPIIDTFSPVRIVKEIMKRTKDTGELPIDIWESEVE